ncbi:MAG: lipid-A-disaccharide synthase [Leptolyngbya sp. RL_3_1]|nr:lipid-A-disaccharide synthase [Leptolyngbya sp. RL_3_1]
MVERQPRLDGDRPNLQVFISTGEVSGDLQGSLLIQALYRQAAIQGLTLTVTALGGQKMAAAGAQLLGETTGIGSVGILEALPYIVPTLQMQHRAKQQLLANPPDVAVYIDYMGPNLSLGKFIRQHLPQVATVYYIAPQQWVWAFNDQDTEALITLSDRMLAIFPQEASYYQRFGGAVTWVGHPLVDRFANPPDRSASRQTLGLSETEPVVTLIPASRHQEVTHIAPLMFAAAQRIQAGMPGVKFLLPVSMASLKAKLERSLASYGLPITLVEGNSQMAIAAADVALTKSGTVNLEIALMKVPQVVTYRLNPLTARIGYHLLRIRIPFVSPVNLVLPEPIVPEIIQWHATPDNLAEAVLRLLNNSAERQAMLAGYERLRQQLGAPGACDRAAQAILETALTQATSTVST